MLRASFARWTASTILSAGVTLALMGMLWSMVSYFYIDDDFGCQQYCPVIEVAELLPIFVETEEDPIIISDDYFWVRKPPQIDTNAPPIAPIEFPIPEMEIIDPGGDLVWDIFRERRQLVPIYRAPPEYPRLLTPRGIEGYAVVEFSVAPDGSVMSPRIVASEPSDYFDEATLTAIRQWRYAPQTDDEGNPISVSGQQVRIDYQLSDEGTDR